MIHIEYSRARIQQMARFYRDGSALAGTLTGGPLGLETQIDVVSDEPPERIRHLVDMAEASCFALQSLMRNVEVTSTFTHNGEPLPEKESA